MAMTTTELEKAFNSLSDRLTQIERLLNGTASAVALNQLTLLLQKDIQDLQADVTSLTNRVSTLEDTVTEIV
jgi:phage-related tail protein